MRSAAAGEHRTGEDAPQGLGLTGTNFKKLSAMPGGSETHPWQMPSGERL